MAIVEVKVPQLSESVAEATLLQWKKKPGDAVAMDEILIEIETDKVVLEVPAPADGVLTEHVVADGGTVTSDQLIARIDTEGKAGAAAAPAAAPPAPAAAAPAAAPTARNKSGVAMPAAAKLMADHGLAGDVVAGTGKGGRITKGDVLAVLEGAAPAAPARAPAPSPAAPAPAPRPLPSVAAPPMASLGDRPEQRVPMSRLRARVAERLLQSQATAAIAKAWPQASPCSEQTMLQGTRPVASLTISRASMAPLRSSPRNQSRTSADCSGRMARNSSRPMAVKADVPALPCAAAAASCARASAASR
jgi:2-oxoglutarate dehydrogenase E2 component (dihydrolipoamide succinyltransferase)